MDDNQSVTDNTLENSFEMTNERHKMEAQIELYCQENHQLRRKLELQDVILKDLQEMNEAIERSRSQQVSENEKALREIDEKHRINREEYQSRIMSYESQLSEKERKITELRASLKKLEEIVAAIPNNEESTLCDNDITVLEKRVEELSLLLQEEVEKREQAENTIEKFHCRTTELENILAITRENLSEAKAAFENAREELAMVRAEINVLKSCPTEDARKGNSVFAEVEDRRKETINKYAALKEKYIEAKHIQKAQANEINLLKTKCVGMLKNYENDTIDTMAENEKLINEYKAKLSELETKLNADYKKNSDLEEVVTLDPSYEYFQSLILAKKKEIQEQQAKIDKLSIQLLVQEEVKLNFAKQMRYWKHKAWILETKNVLTETNLGLNINDGKNNKIFDDIDDTNGLTNQLASSNSENLGDMKSSLDNNNTAKPTNDSTKSEKTVRFSEETKENVSAARKLLPTKPKYPVLYIP